MTAGPLISICIPAYKHVALTQQAVRSVLIQNEDVELIILDDFYLLENTSANVQQLEDLRESTKGDSRVKWFSNTTLLPIQENWNKVVSLCTGKYIKLIGADDLMLADSIQKMQNIIHSEPSIEFFGHLATVIDAQGSVIRQQRPYATQLVSIPIVGASALKGKLRQKVRFKEPACNFYRKNAWERVGGYDDKFRFTFDIHFNCKMMSSSISMLSNEYLVALRRHQASDGAQLPATLALNDLQGLLDDILQSLGDEITMFDRAAASGLLQYRLIELILQKTARQPKDIINLIFSNMHVFFANPISFIYAAELVFGRAIHDDVQQH